MKDSDFLPKIEKSDLTPLEQYARMHRQLREKIAEENPEMDHIIYDEGLLIASPADFPIIDQNGNVGKSYLTNELKTDLTDDVAKSFIKEFRVDEKELYKFLGFKDRHMSNKEFKYAIFAFRIRKMFKYFEELLPEINEKRFPEEQDYSEIEKKHKIDDTFSEDFVAAETIYANTREMIRQKLISEEVANEVLRLQLVKTFGSR